MTIPRVSIGLPTFDGERYLAAAIESILGQTYGDFELIVSDNASTDGTAAICRDFAARDRRVVCFRQERNLGQGPNHNFCVGRARGEYFRWAADDDLLEPQYLEKCVARLEADPGAVLCHSATRIVGERGESIAGHLPGLDAARPSDRFAAIVLRPHWCVEMYGVIRTGALRRTNLMSGYFGGDKTLLAELALLGRFLHVPEPLFLNRDHPGRSLRAVPFQKRQEFHDTAHTRRRVTHWALYTDYWRAVLRHVGDPAERRRCERKLLRWWFTNLHAVRLAADAACLIPGVAAPLFRLREAYHRAGIGAASAR